MKKFFSLMLTLCTGVLYVRAADDVQDRAPHEHAEERGVEVSAAAAKLIGLKTAKVEMRVLAARLSVPARVVQNPLASRVISAASGGFVSYTGSAPTRIEAHARFFEFASPEAAAKFGELQALEARAAAVAAAGAKNAQLKTDLAIARVTYQALTNGLVTLSAEDGRFAQVVPFSGYITGFDVAPGAFVERGAALARVTVDMPPCILARVPVGEACELSDGNRAAVSGEKGTLTLDRTRNDGLVDVWFSFDAQAKPANHLVHLGESVILEIHKTHAGTAVPAIPTAAVFRDGLEPTVLVRDEHDADRFVTRMITPGDTANGWVEVKGLKPGDEVVVQGLYELRQALPGRGGEKRAAGHFHADGKFHVGGHDGE